MLSIPKTHYTECSVYRILIRPKSRYAEDSLHRNYFFQNGFGIVTIRCNGIRCSEYLKQNLIYTDILIHWYTLIYNDINWDKLRSQIRIIWWVWTISELLLWIRKWTASNFLVIFRDGSSPYFLPCLKFSSNDFFSDFFSDLFETTTPPPPNRCSCLSEWPFFITWKWKNARDAWNIFFTRGIAWKALYCDRGCVKTEKKCAWLRKTGKKW